jgi:hypothetical protein
MRTWLDENTGREVRRLTAYAEGARVPYFRLRRHIPDSRFVTGEGTRNSTALSAHCRLGGARTVPRVPAHRTPKRLRPTWRHAGWECG